MTAKLGKRESDMAFWRFALAIASLFVFTTHAPAAPGDVLARMDNPDTEVFGYFGTSIAALGNLILVYEGYTGKIFVYEGENGSPDLGDLLLTITRPPAGGFTSALDAEAEIIAAGDFRNNTGASNAGAVWILNGDRMSPSFGNPLLMIPAPDPVNGGRFGTGIALKGGKALIGASQRPEAGMAAVGAAYLFDVDPESPTFGQLLITFDNPTPAENDEFGAALAWSGANVLINSCGDDDDGDNTGAVYMFNADPMSMDAGSILHRFANPEPWTANYYSESVAAADDTLIAVSAHGDSTVGSGKGAVYLFDADLQSPAFGGVIHKIPNPVPANSHSFGGDALLFGQAGLLVGSRFYFDDLVSTEHYLGAVLLLDADPQSPSIGSLLMKFDNPDPNLHPAASDSHFGDQGTISVIGYNDLIVGDLAYAGSGLFPQGIAWLLEGLPPPAPSATATPSPIASPGPTPTHLPCCPGDADNSGGLVDAFDFISVQANFGAEVGPGDPGDADCSGGMVDAGDFLAVQILFGSSCDGPSLSRAQLRSPSMNLEVDSIEFPLGNGSEI